MGWIKDHRQQFVFIIGVIGWKIISKVGGGVFVRGRVIDNGCVSRSAVDGDEADSCTSIISDLLSIGGSVVICFCMPVQNWGEGGG